MIYKIILAILIVAVSTLLCILTGMYVGYVNGIEAGYNKGYAQGYEFVRDIATKYYLSMQDDPIEKTVLDLNDITIDVIEEIEENKNLKVNQCLIYRSWLTITIDGKERKYEHTWTEY